MKKSNKGFSLVELIIVIAIMAILIAVLAPQYLKYVEKTKKNTDAKAFGEVVQATEVAIADPVLNPTSASVTVTWNGTAFTVSGGAAALQGEVNEVITGNSSSNSLGAKSKAYSSATTSVQFNVDSNGNWTKQSNGWFESYVNY
jgi:type IV pilus assembly protein PilA